ncbi:carboxyl transferase domain-containing protein [Bradyrhizobium manausense]|uniref:acyl-CoA carboxylase subunit beta n=1 Tax=Bradyrhizobium manausense TaxID=989370 RepID=UPI0028981478|nr:carboxyl transferase domain-containing protein [Bradyrhizobium manausense]
MPLIENTIRAGSEFDRKASDFSVLLEMLRDRHGRVLAGGGEKLRARHIERGKIPVRERIDHLVDPLSPFLELSALAAWDQYGNEVPSAGIVTGIGIVTGLPCMIIANDATVKGGSFFHETVKKHLRAQEIAEANKLPCIYLVDCGGAFLPEQDRVFPDRDHFGGTFFQQCRMSAAGLPQISAVFGGCTAGGAYIPALSDEVVMVRGTGRIHLGGPPIVKAAIKEVVDGETLGGAEMHTTVSGVSDYLAESELEAIAKVRDIVGALKWPREVRSPRPVGAPVHDPAEIPGIVGTDLKQPYDVRQVIARIVDGSQFQEFKPAYGSSLVCGFAAIHGEPVGILANNGVLFSESAVKGAHFIELCDQRRTPIVFLQNITGFMVGTEAERGGIAKHSAKLVYAVSNARVPRYTVIIGGSYGAGNYGMCGRGFQPRFLFAWPNARIATMSAEVAANVVTDLRRGSLTRGTADEEEIGRVDRETRAQFEAQSTPYYATSRLWDDGIIEPDQTRDVLGFCLSLASQEIELPGNRPVYRM